METRAKFGTKARKMLQTPEIYLSSFTVVGYLSQRIASIVLVDTLERPGRMT